MAGYLFEYASAAKSPARVSCLVLQLLVRFGVSKQLFALSKMMTDAPTDIDGVFAFKRQNFAKERFYSVVHSQPPVWPAGLERAPGARAGTIVCLDWPMHVGIVLSAAPDGTPIMAVNYS